MGKFNKKLSQLEAVYQVAEPVIKSVKPRHISDFMHYIFENQTEYKLEGLSKDWFNKYYKNNESKAVNFVFNILQENGYIISKRSILEGIEIFQKDEI